MLLPHGQGGPGLPAGQRAAAPFPVSGRRVAHGCVQRRGRSLPERVRQLPCNAVRAGWLCACLFRAPDQRGGRGLAGRNDRRPGFLPVPEPRLRDGFGQGWGNGGVFLRQNGAGGQAGPGLCEKSAGNLRRAVWGLSLSGVYGVRGFLPVQRHGIPRPVHDRDGQLPGGQGRHPGAGGGPRNGAPVVLRFGGVGSGFAALAGRSPVRIRRAALCAYAVRPGELRNPEILPGGCAHAGKTARRPDARQPHRLFRHPFGLPHGGVWPGSGAAAGPGRTAARGHGRLSQSLRGGICFPVRHTGRF